jgi:prepilin-type processing-associated H-X9-DG protein
MSPPDSQPDDIRHQQRPHPGASLSLLLGTASLLFAIVTGLPAVIVGYRALYAINASEGRLTGRRAALAGMVLGSITSFLTILGLIVLIFVNLRSTSQLEECKFNLGRIGMAVNIYHDQSPQKVFPSGTVINPALEPDERISWQAPVLLYLDEGQPTAKKWLEIYKSIDMGKPWMNNDAKDSIVARYLCPSNPNFDPSERPAPTHYVGIAGVGPDAAMLPMDDARAGFFGYNRVIHRNDVQAGISNTLMAVESAYDNGPWIAGGFATVRGIDPAETRLIGPNAPFGGCHSGGMNALYVDGSVRFVNVNIDPAVFRQLALLKREDVAP